MNTDGDAIQEALEGRPPDAEAAELAAVARSVAGLRIAGPDEEARRRAWARLEARMEGRRGGPAAWLLGWVGIGTERRPLVQRLAAGAVLMAAAVGGATAAGVDGTAAIRGVAEFAANAVRNLGPGGGEEGGTALETATPGAGQSPAPTQGAAATHTPGAGGATGVANTLPASPSPGPGTGGGGPPTPTVTVPAPTATPAGQTPTPTATAADSTPTASPTPGDDDDDDGPGADDDGGGEDD